MVAQSAGGPANLDPSKSLDIRVADLVGDSLMGTLANEQHTERDHAERLIAQNSVKEHLIAFVVGTP